jgi:membrane protein YqaA with SNARE-associated domain
MSPDPQFVFAISVWGYVRHLGGLGLVLLGIADSSLIPLTGSMDVLTIYLAALHRDMWPFYALMATAGAMIGGYITYSLAREGGKEVMAYKLSPERAAQVSRAFERWGFGAVAVPAILPPPFPIVPFLLAAGALQYSRKKFLVALAVGRGTRFTIVAGLGALYGDRIVGFFSQYYKPTLVLLIGLAVLGTLVTLLKLSHARRSRAAHRN